MKILANDPHLLTIGRVDYEADGTAVWCWACTHTTLNFKGSSIAVDITNIRSYGINEVGYFIDGEMKKFALEEDREKHTYVIEEKLDPTVEHKLMLYKRQDAYHFMKLHSIEIGGDAVLLDADKPMNRRIEVFGDSVSCGECCEALDRVGMSDPEPNNGIWSNSYYSYSWLTARRLKAELHDSSQGGIALLKGTGYFADPDFYGTEDCYDKAVYSPALLPFTPWDFKKYTPHVVIVALGQNDNHPDDYMKDDYNSDKSKNWRSHYKAFLEKLLEKYPKATMICNTTILGHDPSWDRAIDDVVKEMNNPKVHHFAYARTGCGTPGHIRVPEAKEMAWELTEFIESLGEEIWND